MEAVTARVTDDIKRDMDERFGRFERALERITATPAPSQPNMAVNTGPTSTDDSNSVDMVSVTTSQQPMDVSHHSNTTLATGNKQHGTTLATETPFQRAQQAPHAAIPHPEARPASAHDVNKNKDTHTWRAWSATQQHPEHNQAGNQRVFNFEEDALYDKHIDAQVRHIIEATPHHLKGNLPYDFPYNYVTRGPDKRKLSFNTVTLAEHIYGMFCMLDDSRLDPAVKPDIIEHMKEVAEDACEFEWPGYVRRWSEKVFSRNAEKSFPQGWGSVTELADGYVQSRLGQAPGHKRAERLSRPTTQGPPTQRPAIR